MIRKIFPRKFVKSVIFKIKKNPQNSKCICHANNCPEIIVKSVIFELCSLDVFGLQNQ